MTLSLILLCVWVLLAAASMVLLPGKRSWWAAYGLIALGLPLLVYITVENGWIWGGIALAVGLWTLRWPTRYLLRWCKRQLHGKEQR